MNWLAVGYRVLVEEVSPENLPEGIRESVGQAGGIMLPGSASTDVRFGRVLSVGNMGEDIGISKGDLIVFSYGGAWVRAGSKTLCSIKKGEVIARWGKGKT